MFTVNQTTKSKKIYFRQKAWSLKGVSYITVVLVVVDFIKSQIAEIELLQLVPGYYLLIVFLLFLFLVSVSFSAAQLPSKIDNKKDGGLKSLNRSEIFILGKWGSALTLAGWLIVITVMLPLAFDSVDPDKQIRAEDLWSFDEVVGLEILLGIFLTILAQIPIFSLLSINTENEVSYLLNIWKIVIVFISIASGIVTPTVDGWTQSCLGCTAFSIYLIILAIIGKRLNLRTTIITANY